ncbi:hypothetical protein WA158_003971 [Blastocystis sp. Blastoise]
MDKQTLMNIPYQEGNTMNDDGSRPESAPPSVEFFQEPQQMDNKMYFMNNNMNMYNKQVPPMRSQYSPMAMYEDQEYPMNVIPESFETYSSRSPLPPHTMSSMLQGELTDPRMNNIPLDSSLVGMMQDNEPDTIISQPIRMKNTPQNDQFNLNSQFMIPQMANILDEEIRNSSKSAPAVYRQDYRHYNFGNYRKHFDAAMYDPIMEQRNDTIMDPYYNYPAYPQGNYNYPPAYPPMKPLPSHMPLRPRQPALQPANAMFSPKSSASPNPMLQPTEVPTMDSPVMIRREKKLAGASPSWTHGGTESYKGHIYEMSKDQRGCRLLQQCLDEGGSAVVEMIYCEVESHLVDLMHDSFGNYLFQKLLDNSSDEQRRQVLNKVYNSIVEASLDVHGTRSVQKIIQTCRQPDMVELIMNSIHSSIDKLSSNSNGNHVIQRCLQYMPSASKAQIFDEVIKNCYSIATHRHGCCVVQRCLDLSPADYHDKLLAQIVEHAVDLMQNPFGNYVVQYLIENGQPVESQRLIQCVLGHVVPLSCQKYSSNVIEKSLKYSTEKLREQIIREIASSNQLRSLLHQEYANYVIQKALLLGSKAQRLHLLKAIAPYEADLTRSTGGRHILAKLQDIPELTLEVGDNMLQE